MITLITETAKFMIREPGRACLIWFALFIFIAIFIAAIYEIWSKLNEESY